MSFAILFLICFGDYLLWFDLSAADKVNSSVLIITAVAIIVYTAETYDLKRIQQKQFEYENKPFFRLMWASNETDVFHITNQGKGIAVDVTIESVILGPRSFQTAIVIKKRPAYSPGSTSAVTETELRENSRRDSRFNLKGYIEEELCGGKFPKLQMRYFDLMGNIYEAWFQPDEAYNDKFRIISQKKIGTLRPSDHSDFFGEN
jgi:hypothetical protein